MPSILKAVRNTKNSNSSPMRAIAPNFKPSGNACNNKATANFLPTAVTAFLATKTSTKYAPLTKNTKSPPAPWAACKQVSGPSAQSPVRPSAPPA
jgi:hypothetical protein